MTFPNSIQCYSFSTSYKQVLSKCSFDWMLYPMMYFSSLKASFMILIQVQSLSGLRVPWHLFQCACYSNKDWPFLVFLKIPISAVPLPHMELEVRIKRTKGGVKLPSMVPVSGDSQELAWLTAFQGWLPFCFLCACGFKSQCNIFNHSPLLVPSSPLFSTLPVFW